MKIQISTIQNVSMRISHTGRSGFALIATISVMVLLAMIALAIISLSTITLRGSSQDQATEIAQSNARMALMLAIAQLQEAAGPDQRITASADVLGGSITVTEGRAHWTGVWSTKDYDPKNPEEREFVRWLVSSPTDTEPSPSDEEDPDDFLIFDAAADDADPIAAAESSVKVPKVKVDKGSGKYAGAYAYWVEDEGVKADLSWNEGDFSNDAQGQLARLSSASGPDYEAFGGPFGGRVTYPIKLDAGNSWLENMEKALSAVDMPLVLDAGDGSRDWLRENRHNMTLGSLGVMSDVKLGGLRRDLSLAFEMDEEAQLAEWNSGSASFETNNLPTKFLSQYGEFVGERSGTDVMTGAFSVDGLTTRYVYANNRSAGLPFSEDIQASSAVVRGPTWFALRDYANAYKRLTGTPGNYSIASRPTYPNGSSRANSGNGNIIELIGSLQPSLVYDGIDATGGAGTQRYLEKPYQSNYAPVRLGYTVVLSVMSVPDSAGGEKLALGIDPIFYLWNPYNHRLTAEKYLVHYRTALPGQIKIWIDDRPVIRENVREFIGRAAGFNPSNFNRITYTFRDIDLAPGEVKIFSPPLDGALASAGSRHPFNTDALPGADLSATSGASITKFPTSWGEIKLADFENITIGFGFTNSPDANFVHSSFPLLSANNNSFRTNNTSRGLNSSVSTPKFYFAPGVTALDKFEPELTITSADFDEGAAAGPYSSDSISGSKQFCGVFSILNSPANFEGPEATPVEIFARFNPLAQAVFGNTNSNRVGSWNQEMVVINKNFGSNFTAALDATGIVLPAVSSTPGGRPDNGYWGNSYKGDGSGSLTGTVVPILDVPTGPIMSLAHFAHANLGVTSDEPLMAVGNSFASLFIEPVSPYGVHPETLLDGRSPTIADSSWLLNDALFDRYYLSGIAPEFTLSGSYQQTEDLEYTLTRFFGEDYKEANANPALRPYLPGSVSASEAVEDLTSDDGKGYLKMGAYSLINGMFNVNSTSVEAWKALLRANKGLDVSYAQGDTSTGSDDTPYPKGAAPVSSDQAAAGWGGLSRLTDSEIDTLAEEIVNQVKIRGPFMSLSDFVNHRLGDSESENTRYMGALQAAIEDSGINDSVVGNASGTTVDYGSSGLSGSFASPISGARPTTTGIATDITQADILMPLAPRLSARSDTFRIRAYGEALSDDGSEIIASAMCEAVVQRIPEYVDSSDDPWLEAYYNPFEDPPGDPRIEKESNLNLTNQKYGRKFKVVAFRWLSNTEI